MSTTPPSPQHDSVIIPGIPVETTVVPPVVEEATKTIEKETTDLPEINPESPFAPFNDLRQEMIKGGVDFTALDAKVQSGEPLSTEDIQLISKHSGHSEKDINAYMKVVGDLHKATQKATTYDTQQQAAYEAELNEVAGGSYKDLIDWHSQNTPPTQIKIFNTLLNAKDEKGNFDSDLQKTALKQMQEIRQAKSPPNKSANLDLLTKANATTPTVPKPDTTKTEPQEDPLKDNPLAGASVNALCALKMNPKHAQHENAMAVLKVKHPDLV